MDDTTTTEAPVETPVSAEDTQDADLDDLGGAVEMYAEALEEADESDAGAYGDGNDDADIPDADVPESDVETDADPEPEEDQLVQVSQKDLNALLARIEAQIGGGMPEGDATEETSTDAEAQEPPAETPAEIQAPSDASLQFPDMTVSEEEHYNIQSDPKAFNDYIQKVQARTVEATMQQMQPLMMKAAMQVHGAMAFERRFFEEHPELEAYPELVNKAILSAKAKNPGGTFDQWGKVAAENLAEVIAIRKQLTKHGKPRDTRGGNRGRFAPASARRAPVAAESAPQAKDPTEAALREIAGLEGSSEDLMRGLGVL